MAQKPKTQVVQARQQQGTLASFQIQQEAFSGPIPPPALMADYDRVVPRGAERIMAMAEEQQKHRHDLEKAVVNGNLGAQKFGQWTAFIIALLAIGCGTFLIWIGKGNEGYGIAMVLSTIATLAGVFIWGKKQQENERKAKVEQLPQQLQ